MSSSLEQLRQVDRLVDGELSLDERRELLQALDAMPGGWRACALAFVESQSLREQLAALESDVQSSAEASPVTPANAAAASRSSAGMWLAMAASALLAFGLGTFVRQAFKSPAIDPGTVAVDTQQATSDVIAAAPTKANDGESLTVWVTDDQGERRSVTAALIDAQQLDDQYGLQIPSSISPRLRQRLEGRGYQLSTRRRYAPLFLENGRPLVVPVEDVQIVPVKSTAL